MGPARLLLPLLLSLAYLSATVSPCPTPGLDRTGVGRSAYSQAAVKAPEPDPHAGHARAGQAASSDHSQHHARAETRAPASGHAPGHVHAHEAVTSKPAADPATDPPAIASVQMPCQCGCGDRATAAATGGRLGPVLLTASPAEASAVAAYRHPADDLPLLPEPFRTLDPIPI
jgi:hypothetical protein